MKHGTKNTRIYLDTSVFLKEFSEESKSEIIHRIFDLCSTKKLIIVISQWTINESIWALDKKHMKGELLEQERNYVIFGMLEKVNQLVSQGQILQVSLTDEVARSSTAIITDKHLSPGDALHLFSAIVASCDVLLLADKRFAERAKDSGDFEIFNIMNDDDYSNLEEFLAKIEMA